MVLSDLFKPNSFGNVPIVYLHESNKVLKPLADSYQTHDGITFKADAELMTTHKGTYICDRHFCSVIHVVPATAENRLVQMAVRGTEFPVNSYDFFIKKGILFSLQGRHMLKTNILDDGSGWIHSANSSEPVDFYLQDILYRLDLLSKTT